MTGYLVRNNLLIFIYTKFADYFEKIRINAKQLATINHC